MNARLVRVSMVALVMLTAGCAVLQRESPEKKAREFMVLLEQSLARPDQEILKFFETSQSAESLLAAINLLQNEDSDQVECFPDFSRMQLEVENVDESLRGMFNQDGSLVKVSVPVTIQPRESGESQTVDIVFRLREQQNQFVVYQLEGDVLYNTFTSMKYEILYAQHQLEEVKNREAIYVLADSLRKNYDFVAWYAVYRDKPYFYVVNGDWSEEFLYSQENPRPVFKMGLVDESGKEIVPVEFDMIGTIGAEVDNAVEVKGAEGYGYFSLGGDTLVPPSFSQVIPFVSPKITWVVQFEGEFGWIDQNKTFTPGYPDDTIKKNILTYSYLPSGITINEGSYALCEAPNMEQAGSGIFISPSYWVEAGLLDPVKMGITTTVTDAPIGGWTEYIELGETFFQSITESFGVVIATFKERYLEGREEFYEHKKLLFKDSLQNTVLTQEFSGDDLEIKLAQESIIEVKSIQRFNDEFFDGMPLEGEMQGRNYYRYYSFVESETAGELTSNRAHPETQFARLDDTYIKGDFRIYKGEDAGWETLTAYPVEYLITMRNEILADYGVIFTDAENKEHFERFKWYAPRFGSETEIKDQLNEVDEHNLDFLARVIRNSQQGQSM